MYFLRHLDKVIQLFQLIQEIRKIGFYALINGLTIGVDNYGTKRNCINVLYCIVLCIN